MKNDPIYGTAYFETREGMTSCMWEVDGSTTTGARQYPKLYLCNGDLAYCLQNSGSDTNKLDDPSASDRFRDGSAFNGIVTFNNLKPDTSNPITVKACSLAMPSWGQNFDLYVLANLDSLTVTLNGEKIGSSKIKYWGVGDQVSFIVTLLVLLMGISRHVFPKFSTSADVLLAMNKWCQSLHQTATIGM